MQRRRIQSVFAPLRRVAPNAFRRVKPARRPSDHLRLPDPLMALAHRELSPRSGGSVGHRPARFGQLALGRRVIPGGFALRR